jgi:CheY-like chemotaxis protein
MKRILVADDNSASRELLRETLEMAGYIVVEAADGEEALERIAEAAPDLALMDIQMPGLDGFGVLKRLRSDGRYRELKVVALTAFAMQGDVARALEAGFDDYITKPIDIAALRKRISEILR